MPARACKTCSLTFAAFPQGEYHLCPVCGNTTNYEPLMGPGADWKAKLEAKLAATGTGRESEEERVRAHRVKALQGFGVDWADATALAGVSDIHHRVEALVTKGATAAEAVAILR